MWDSIEILKLIVSLLTPITILIVGTWIRKYFMNLEGLQWESQALIEWKIKIYEEISPKINDVYSYLLYLGAWKSKTPVEVIELKRELDKSMSIVGPLFSIETNDRYSRFQDVCFETFRGLGLDAGIKSGFQSRQLAFGDKWIPEWDKLFVSVDSDIHKQKVEKFYNELIESFLKELQITRHKLSRIEISS